MKRVFSAREAACAVMKDAYAHDKIECLPRNKKASVQGTEAEIGAKDGARSRDNQIHNLGLYQLSYFRQKRVVL